MVYLATQPGDGLSNSQAIAGATKVPGNYISKILKDLVRAGLVHSRRGPNGGFRLAKLASSICVLDVVNAVDPIQRIVMCPLGLPDHSKRLCRLHQRLDDTIRLVEEALRSAPISEMTDAAKPGAKLVFPMIRGVKKSR